ncbi:MAG: ribonuclease P protein component [Papillibacter sp.]|jgi:ribonuclease P protein component|nr:ribonuclease P protein component [Papillibacter sp.]
MKTTLSLNKNYEFRRLYSRGKSYASPLVVIYCSKNHGTLNRLGITVGAKVGKAVRRNRVRRRIREIYRLNADRLKTGWDIVVVARAKAAEATYRDIESEFLKAAERLSLIRK